MAEGWGAEMETAQLEPVDAEDLLRIDLSTDDVAVCAPPAPDDLGAHLPIAMVQRDGGSRINRVMDQHNVTVSVWAETWADAMACANRLAGAVARLPMTGGTSTQWRTADVTGLPSNAPDPAHPTIPRVQFTASVACRASN